MQMILVASPSKPALMTDKGTVRRSATLGQYADEIKALYHDFEASAHGIIPVPASWDLEKTTDFVRSVVFHALGPVDDDQDIFDVGCARSVVNSTASLFPLIELHCQFTGLLD